jgi:hypothetical protein
VVASSAAPRKNAWLPWVIGLAVVVALGVGGYFLFPSVFQPITNVLSPQLSATEYKAKLLEFRAQMETAFGPEASQAIQDASSGDSASIAGAKAAFDTAIRKARAAIATVRGLKPPAEFQAAHARILKGLDVYETVLKATETYVAAAVNSGGDTATLESASAAYTAALSAPGIETTMSDFQAAFEEVTGQSAGTSTTP